jgi:hypothetical protein
MCCDDDKLDRDSGDFQINTSFSLDPNLGVPGTYCEQKLLLNGNYRFNIRFVGILTSNNVTAVGTTGAPVFFFMSPQIANPATGVNYFALAQSNGLVNPNVEYNYVFDAYVQGYLEFNFLVGDVYNVSFPERSPVRPSSRNNLRIANDYYTTATGAGVNTIMQVTIEYSRKT